jgi:DNA polymerase-3 subunit epsilon
VIHGYDEPTTPLHQVTFCVVDLETTGTSPTTCGITEVGAAKFRGGECLGTFQSLVDAGLAPSPAVARLTGITGDMVAAAPPLSGVLAALLEFVGGAVLVGHNLRFDVAFLDAALTARERAALAVRTVDTVALARRLLRGDVDDCRLGTLAEQLGLDHRPSHRALSDVLATADLLHLLLERAAGLGVGALDDLLALPASAGHPQAPKLALTSGLPRAPGVYVLRDSRDRPVYVGWATDLRCRVRSFFVPAEGDGEAADEQRAVGHLLRVVHRIEHRVCPTPLGAEVTAIRLAQALQPRHDRRAGRWRGYRYVTVAGSRRAPRLAVTRDPRPRGDHLGPQASTADARALIAAVEAVAGDQAGAMADVVGEAEAGGRLPLTHRLERLVATATAGASGMVGRAVGVVRAALGRQRRRDVLRRAGRLVLALPDGGGVELMRGRLVRTWAAGEGEPEPPCADGRTTPEEAPPPAPEDGPVPREMLDELDVVAGWFDRMAGRLRPLHVGGELSSPLPWRPVHAVVAAGGGRDPTEVSMAGAARPPPVRGAA